MLQHAGNVNHIFFITKEPYTKDQLLALGTRFGKGNLKEIHTLSANNQCVILTDKEVKGGLVKTHKPPFSTLQDVNLIIFDHEQTGSIAIVCKPEELLN
jgi:hypothetical protein